MEEKPIPKPRSVMTERPVPAPRRLPPSLPSARLSSHSDSSQSEKSDDAKSIPETRAANNEFFRNLGTSSRQLKDEISEKMTTKGRAVLSSTRNASIRLEKSVKSLLTRRLTSLNQDDLIRDNSAGSKKFKDPMDNERCASMPADDIFSSISFYSPLNNNLRSVRNEEDLSGTRHSPPPPAYPPPHPDESIYDELQSTSSRYDTISSSISDKIDSDFPELFNLLSFAHNQASDSDQSLNLSDINVALPQEKSDNIKRLSRSNSWTYYDTTPLGKSETVDELDRISSAEEDILDKEVLLLDQTSTASNDSQASIQNSLYENLSPQKAYEQKETTPNSSESRQQTSRSLLFEFDPFAGCSNENVYSNFENNDLMLLETLLATNDSASSLGSILEFQEIIDNDEEQNEVDEENIAPVSSVPPKPPKRYDSLPKNEYDEVTEILPQQDKNATEKNPALLPKLAHLVTRKQPAVPPRKSTAKNRSNESPPASSVTPKTAAATTSDGPVTSTTSSTTATSTDESSNAPSGKTAEECKRVGMIQKLKKLKSESAGHGIRPNVMNLMKSGSKLLSRNRDHGESVVPSMKSTKLERPKVNGLQCLTLTHRGIVYRSGVGIERVKHLVPREAVLANQKLSFYSYKDMLAPKEIIHLDTVYSIHLPQNVKIVDGETVHCIAISGEGRPNVHMFYTKGLEERRIWAQRILDSIIKVFHRKHTAELIRAGWAYLKEGISNTWFPAWVLLYQRTLIYTKSLDSNTGATFAEIDLRKSRFIDVREEEGPNADAGPVPVVIVHAGHMGGLYMAVPEAHEGTAWKIALYQAAVTCGPDLEQQQLTQDNVPVIIHKCINFVYVHGIMSEGIYRQNGSHSAVVALLRLLRRDAWVMQVSRNKFTEHDVATVLRRFLRDLPNPLLPLNIHDQLCLNSENANEYERILTYRKLLSTMTPISAATLKRILAHLYCLSQQSSKNLMTCENLSAIWGPTLMHAGESNAEEWNRSETRVVGDLIKLYPKLYQLNAEDVAKEERILGIIKKYHDSNNGLLGAPSGDLKIWIYIFSKDGECVNVTIGPQKTAFDVCQELAKKANIPAHELCLEEYTLSGALERPLHYKERVLEVVARWGYWDPDDRKDNILILKEDKLYKELASLINVPMVTSGELKFADTKSKNFKNYLFEFSQAKLYCYKDKVCANVLYEWKIEDIIWYLGHEPKRNPQTGWSITFIAKNKKPTRCKESPFFGNTLAGSLKEEQRKWVATMVFAEYRLNVQPPSVNLMDP